MNSTLRRMSTDSLSPLIRPLLMFLFPLLAASCAGPPKLDYEKSISITQPMSFEDDGFDVIVVDPNKTQTNILWQGFDVINGNWAHVPFEIMTVVSGTERYVISDKCRLNGELAVNGKGYRFNHLTECVRIRIGGPVAVIPRTARDTPKKIYELPG